MNTHIRDNLLAIGGSFVYKSANETVNNSDTLQDDDELKFAVGANELWLFQAWIHSTDTTTADLHYLFTGPAGSTVRWSPIPQFGVTGSFHNTDVKFGTAQNTEGNGGHFAVGRIDTAGTSGDLQLQWAQSTATANNTIVLIGSWLTGRNVT